MLTQKLTYLEYLVEYLCYNILFDCLFVYLILVLLNLAVSLEKYFYEQSTNTIWVNGNIYVRHFKFKLMELDTYLNKT